MMKLHAPVIADAEWARPLLEANNYMASDYAFSNIYGWQDVVNTEITRYKDFVIIRVDYKDENIYYQFPAGYGDVGDAIEWIIETSKMSDRPPVLTSIPDEGKNILENSYPDMFTFSNPRDLSDYVYLSTDLANLPGSKYQKKRNHCSHFERSYPNWEFHSISEVMADEIISFTDKWLKQSSNLESSGARDEVLTVTRGLRDFTALGLKGGYLTIDGEIVAFTYGCPMGDEFVIHVEKAMYNFHGIYAFINREMARSLEDSFKYINREDDLGVAGLRKSKMSYRPAFLVNKWRAEFKNWPPMK